MSFEVVAQGAVAAADVEDTAAVDAVAHEELVHGVHRPEGTLRPMPEPEQGDVAVTVDADEAVATLTLTRPSRRNALSIAMTQRFHEALDRVEADPGVRAVVIVGEPPAFCAGADFGDFDETSDRGGFLPMFQDLLERMAHFRIPFVAAVAGPALGAGCQILAACDLRIVATDARIGIPAARIGLQLDIVNLNRLVCEFGPTAARRLLLTGEPVDGNEAAALGFVHEVLPADEVPARAAQWASLVASRAPLSVLGHKAAIQSVVDSWWLPASDPSHARHRDASESVYGSADLREGLAAFAEKRAPRFEGR